MSKKKGFILIALFIFSSKIFAGELLNEMYIYDELILQETTKHQINPELIYSIIKIESHFNEKALSPKGAQGLMQLMPFTAKRFGVTDPKDSKQNLKAGIEYMAFLINRYGDVNYAIAAYNSGENAVEKYKGIPPYKETINYVKKVRAEYTKLTGLSLPHKKEFYAAK